MVFVFILRFCMAFGLSHIILNLHHLTICTMSPECFCCLGYCRISPLMSLPHCSVELRGGGGQSKFLIYYHQNWYQY